MKSSSSEVVCKVVGHGTREYWAAVELRNEILRKPLGLVLTPEELGTETDSHHVVVLEKSRVVGCVVMRPLPNRGVRMRQLCVLESHRGRGIGKALVEFAEELARRLGYTQIVLHARQQVISFYEKLGYVAEGNLFWEVGLPHRLMRKNLLPKPAENSSS